MNLAGLAPILQAIGSIGSVLVVVFLTWRVWQGKDATIEAQKAQIEMLKGQSYERMGAVLSGLRAAHEAELKLARNEHDLERIRQLEADNKALETVAAMTVRIIAEHDARNWDIPRQPLNLTSTVEAADRSTPDQGRKSE